MVQIKRKASCIHYINRH